MLKTIKDVSAALGEFELALGELRRCMGTEGRNLTQDEALNDQLGNVTISLNLMRDGVRELRGQIDRELAKPVHLLFADIVNDFDTDDNRKASTAMVTCISILDRCKLHEGLELTTELELERFAALVLAELRLKTGNANLPRGGLQA